MEVPGHFAPAHFPEQQTSSGENSSGRPSTSFIRSSASTARSRSSNGEGNHRGSHESKPRLSKDQQETLERHYQNNTKPTTAAKKEFSDVLGVSVEKINNWFQNRRAKTKQDFKKTQEQNVYQPHEPHTDSFGHPLADDSYIDNAFYQTLGYADSMDMPAERAFPTQRHHDGDLQSRHDEAAFNTPTIFEEPAEPIYGESSEFFRFFGLSDANGYTQHAEVPDTLALSKQLSPTMEHFDPAARFAQLQEDYHSSTAPPSLGHSARNDSMPCFKQSPEDETLNLPKRTQNRNASADSSGNTAAVNSRNSPSSWALMQSPPISESPDPRTVYQQAMKAQMDWTSGAQHHCSGLTSAQNPDFGLDHRQSWVAPHPVLPSQNFHGEQRSSEQPHPAYAHDVSSQRELNIPHPDMMGSDLYHTQGGQQEAIAMGNTEAFRPYQMSQGQENRITDYQTDMQPPARNDSGTSLLAESLDQVDLQSLANNTGTKASQGSSGLATRRQRRPAALGQAALRTVSCNNGPASALDSSSKHSMVPDAHLRRIKSSTGVLNGRIRKTTSSSAQRSPYASTFADAANAISHGSRHASNQSLSAMRSPSHEAFEHPTPPMFSQVDTPHLHIHHASNDSNRTHGTYAGSDMADSVWSAMPDTAATSNSSIYHSMPPTANTARSYLSPPGTPMEPGHMAPWNAHSGHSYSHSYSPQSAPPWQPHFAPSYGHIPNGLSQSLPPQWNPTMDAGGQENDAQQPYHPHNPSLSHHGVEAPAHPAYPLMHASPEYPSGHSRQPNLTLSEMAPSPRPYPSPMHMHAAHHSQPQPSPLQQHFIFPSQPESVHSNDDSMSAVGQSKQVQEIEFQQYEPREPADPSSLPPKSRSTPPKNGFRFENSYLNDFSSPKPASSPLKIACDIDGIHS